MEALDSESKQADCLQNYDEVFFQPEIYQIFYCREAAVDILEKGFKKNDVITLTKFLAGDACKVGISGQKRQDDEHDIWSLRWHKPGHGTCGGWRVLYYHQDQSIFIYRAFHKQEVDFVKKELRDVWLQAIADLKQKLSS